MPCPAYFVLHNDKSYLLRELNGSMKASVLNTIIAYLVAENKIVANGDRSLTWIDAKGNTKLNKAFEKPSRSEFFRILAVCLLSCGCKSIFQPMAAPTAAGAANP